MLVRIPLELVLIRSEPLKDDIISALRQEVELPLALSLAQLPQHNAHTLPRARKLEHVEELELNDALIVGRLDAQDVLVPTEEDESDVGGGLDERGLVGRLSLVREEPVFLRGEDRVAEGEVTEEVVEVLGLVRLLLLQVELDLVVVEGGDHALGELDLGATGVVAVTTVAAATALLAPVRWNASRGIVRRRARERLLGAVHRRGDLVTDVDLAVNRALTEEHRVLREGAGLVRKDVLDLAEVVREVPAASGGAAAVALHVVVAPDEACLDETSEFD